MGMTTPLPTGWREITLVEGPDTIDSDRPRIGTVVIVPPDYPLGSGRGNPGRLLGIYGWTQTGPGGRLEWVMSSVLDAATVDYIRDIPPGGWVDTTARATYRQQIRRLITAGMTAADARDLARTLYLAARTNENATPPP
jgi:hypothetical protein